MSKHFSILNIVAGWGMLMALSACNGVFDGMYDDAPRPAAGDLYVDASSWSQWHYIDLHAIQKQVENGEMPDLTFKTCDIPLERAEAFDPDGTGIYTYWYDVFGEGKSKYELRDKYPTALQPEPEHWDIAVHRNNVRTNGAAVYQTSLKDISQVSATSVYATLPFVADTWNQMDVWTVKDQMLSGMVGSQRIKVNEELSKWLGVEIPPMPPAFIHNGNVFIVRFADGTYAALRLKNYLSDKNVKCCLTIEYKYPL